MQNVMSDESLDIHLLEFFDSISYFVSESFSDKWKYKYSEILIDSFRDVIISALKKNRPVRRNSLLNKLRKKTGLADEFIQQFLEETDAYDELHPVILP